MLSHAFLLYEMQAIVAGQAQEFTEFPPRQRPASFNLDAVMAQVTTALTEHH
jgi:arylsulfatase